MTGHQVSGTPDSPTTTAGARPGPIRGPGSSVLVLNPNSSTAATLRIRSGTELWAGPGIEADVRSVPAGPRGIDRAADIELAAALILRDTPRLAAGHDAVVIACGHDPGLAELRALLPVPVVGIAEAAMLQACLYGGRFSVPVFSPGSVPLVRNMVHRYGLDARLASVVPMATDTAAAVRDPEALLDQYVRAGRTARDRDAADSLVLIGSVVGSLAPELEAVLGIPVVAGLPAALALTGALLATHRPRTPQESTR
ncbi:MULTISPECIES: aspartate/glutamate racemase family protein [unclassified Streptomyces]|uniref:aspartate/glutamate racemase family protein n=1 Tax=unclassified Streptomyces TaxID=2593676 RepID=UPI002555ACC8|nr:MULTISPECIES: aspartate/glutamate racemase family protein [unclassified Streptomyces]WRZ69570.1 aspartate/glutamate racemase family protein [Streptomyces sp. NBC_01257]